VTRHLGAQVMPLVDGELDHNERDLALAHAAVCPACHREVTEARRLKTSLSALAEPTPSADLTARLLRIGGLAPPVGAAGSASAVPVRSGARRLAAAHPAAPHSTTPHPHSTTPHPVAIGIGSARHPAPVAPPARPAGVPGPGRRPLSASPRRRIVGSAAVLILAVSGGAALAGSRAFPDRAPTGPGGSVGPAGSIVPVVATAARGPLGSGGSAATAPLGVPRAPAGPGEFVRLARQVYPSATPASSNTAGSSAGATAAR